ncbi:hypothetical protein E2562_017626 [Oryza meyeriana var. granulata]|uniref:Uncharacterized protein n=1 Tax=Oryza meyeriana var. granulata TaxID=110450 RepID=A0A6G1BXL7_9ORYZ|nr:hypothetical protein E2562_017626 [Oryza meyeriana var. granulata]
MSVAVTFKNRGMTEKHGDGGDWSLVFHMGSGSMTLMNAKIQRITLAMEIATINLEDLIVIVMWVAMEMPLF